MGAWREHRGGWIKLGRVEVYEDRAVLAASGHAVQDCVWSAQPVALFVNIRAAQCAVHHVRHADDACPRTCMHLDLLLRESAQYWQTCKKQFRRRGGHPPSWKGHHTPHQATGYVCTTPAWHHELSKQGCCDGRMAPAVQAEKSEAARPRRVTMHSCEYQAFCEESYGHR